MKLYEISQELIALMQEEETEENFARFDELKGTAKEKLENIGKLIKNLEADKIAYETAKKEFEEKEKRTKKQVEGLKNYCKGFMLSIGLDEVKTDLFKYSFRPSESINILDEDKIPEDYKIKEETYKIDKNAIKEAIKEGKLVQGAILEKNQNLQFK